MKVWASTNSDQPSELPYPSRLPNSSMIRIKAVGINRADLLQRKGLYPPPPGESPILGLECSGIVEEADAASEWSPGDRVCALLGGGGYAEYTTVADSLLLPIPEGMSFEEAAALPEAIFTSYYNLVTLGRMTSPGRLLIHAGGSGIGTVAIQVARLYRHRIAVTAGTEEKRKLAIELGAELAIDYRQSSFREAVRNWTGEVDVILDCIGGSAFDDNIRCLSFGGTLLIIGLLGGVRAEADIGLWLNKNVKIFASTLRNQRLEIKSALASVIRSDLWPYVESGRLKPVIDRVAPIAQWPSLHERMQRNLNLGKMVLTL